MTKSVAEIVTFSLAANIKSAEFVELSKGTEAFVRSLPGFQHRQLSEGEDGRWTDYVVWADMETAKAAAAAFMTADCAASLMLAIDPNSVVMRHEAVLWNMAA
ncbi:MAG: hypothetical protein COB16_15395 [Rhodobacteraceae bacterium]|nr:MAG: hypothetical protein COB16_15395 [Paracoccaceae bacterium]